jgi:DNA helicase-2/ATP-dependent DNA helicase PcrA
VTVACFLDDRTEARFVASDSHRRSPRRPPAVDLAVFYRTNAQSRVLEEELVRAGGVPYLLVRSDCGSTIGRK